VSSLWDGHGGQCASDGGHGKTDDRQHEGDRESERARHESLAERRIVGRWRRKAQGRFAEKMDKFQQRARTLDCHHSHGGTGYGSAHKPFRPSRADSSSASCSLSRHSASKRDFQRFLPRDTITHSYSQLTLPDWSLGKFLGICSRKTCSSSSGPRLCTL